MTSPIAPHANDALAHERSCGLVAGVLSQGHRARVRLVSGERRSFGLDPTRSVVHVPYPGLSIDWDLRTVTCGIALQCSPSKDRLAAFPLRELGPRQLQALTLIEAQVALGWVESAWPGLTRDFRRLLPTLSPLDGELSGAAMLEHAIKLARSKQQLIIDPLLGQLPLGAPVHPGLLAALQRIYGRMPWSGPKRVFSPRFDSIPVGGEGGVQNPNLPPPSRPEEDDVEIRPDQRIGLPYPEWSMWTGGFLRNHVAVVERKHTARARAARPVPPRLRRWFEQHTHREMKGRLEDGADLDVDRYIDHFIDRNAGAVSEARVFRDLLPASRNVSTALLLDGSSSLGAGHGGIFRLELSCADALCQAMTLARERHGLFVFSGRSRHRVDVTCLKDFDDRHLVIPSDLGLVTGGYTRLGAPLRHLTSRLLSQKTERRLLIVIGDGLISDDGYEGRYAWADCAHAAEEAREAGIALYYIGVGSAQTDPLPDVFGPRRSMRIRQVDELPRVLSRVHRELLAA
jgi:hypothetical protein